MVDTPKILIKTTSATLDESLTMTHNKTIKLESPQDKGAEEVADGRSGQRITTPVSFPRLSLTRPWTLSRKPGAVANTGQPRLWVAVVIASCDLGDHRAAGARSPPLPWAWLTRNRAERQARCSVFT